MKGYKMTNNRKNELFEAMLAWIEKNFNDSTDFQNVTENEIGITHREMKELGYYSDEEDEKIVRAIKECLPDAGIDFELTEKLEEEVAFVVDMEQPIPYVRLSELATLFKDGLLQDDEESAYEYFSEECDMTEEEFEYFGLDKGAYDEEI